MKRTFSFIHAADIHLDSPLGGLPAHDPEAAATIRAAPRKAFERLVDSAIERKVSFIILAGDLYDGGQKDINTAIFFGRQMGRLREHGIRVYALFGNHDYESPLTGQLPHSDNLYKFPSDKPGSFHIQDLGVSLHGQSYARRDVTANLAKDYPPPVASDFNIGVLHTALGRSGHDPYAPASAEQLRDHGYQYWALGHVHQHEIVNESPPIVFPGNIQGRHIGETGPKGAMLIQIGADGTSRLERLILDLVRWHRISVEISASESHEDVICACAAAIAKVIQHAADLQPGHLHACRVELGGATRLHGSLLWRSNELQDEIAAAAASNGAQIWIEQVELKTRPPAQAAAAIGGDLRSLLDQVLEDPQTLAAIREDQEDLPTLPREVLELLQQDRKQEADGNDPLHQLAREGAGIALARLIEGNG